MPFVRTNFFIGVEWSGVTSCCLIERIVKTVFVDGSNCGAKTSWDFIGVIDHSLRSIACTSRTITRLFMDHLRQVFLAEVFLFFTMDIERRRRRLEIEKWRING